MTLSEDQLAHIEKAWKEIWEAVLKEDHRIVYETFLSIMPGTTFAVGSFEEAYSIDRASMIAYSIIIYSLTVTNEEAIKLPKIELDRLSTILKLLIENRKI